MQIKILDSWLRDYLKTKATPKQIGHALSLSSVSVERIDKHNNDYVYDIEVTTNRPDLMSVVGLAQEAAAVLPQFKIKAEFVPRSYQLPEIKTHSQLLIHIDNDPKLVRRICAIIMEVAIKPSPKQIQERLETSDIRSLNNVIDVTNYIMRVTGHPTHVFDYDRLTTRKMIVRESTEGEHLTTLDNKNYTLKGGDIVVDNGNGEIIDLMGVMGTANSVVTDETKRILFFVDNVEPNHIRKTSMNLGIRTEAAVLNEKGIDESLSMHALVLGIKLLEKIADAKPLSKVIDLYPEKSKEKTVSVSEEKIQSVIGVPISLQQAEELLKSVGFAVKIRKNELEATVPAVRNNDIEAAEDLIEEIARLYGYHNLPSVMPPTSYMQPSYFGKTTFYWEERIKKGLRYWGFIETYTYAFVSEAMYEGPVEDAVTIQNPLNDELVYMRTTLTPSLLEVVKQNSARQEIKIFEIANVYHKKGLDLPEELLKLAGVVKKPQVSFFEAKGIIQQMLKDCGIQDVNVKKRHEGGLGADVFIGKEKIGDIEVLEDNIIDFEIDFGKIVEHATLHRNYKPIAKYPPIVEDLAFVFDEKIETDDIIETIKNIHKLIIDVSLLDQYHNSRTFHIVYQDPEKNLTSDDVKPIREKIIKIITGKFEAEVK